MHIPVETLYRYFHVDATREYHKGDVIARGYVDTGDHVFVDKISYNFRPPRRGEVFVFNTKNIMTPENKNNPEGPSQYYIKRLAGVPGDTLRIDSPNLFINGEIARGIWLQAGDGGEGRGIAATREREPDGDTFIQRIPYPSRTRCSRCRRNVILRWVTTATTARTAGTGGSCRSRTSWDTGCLFIGLSIPTGV